MDLTPEQVRADFEEVVRQLEEVHADAVSALGEAVWTRWREDTRARLDRVTDDAAFWWEVAPMVAARGDGHTELRPPDTDDSLPRVASWSVRVDELGLWVEDFGAHPGPPLPEGGARLSSVDGVDGQRIATELLRRSSGETAGFRSWKVEEQLYGTLDLAVDQLSGADQDGPWRVVLDLGGGRAKEGVVSPRPFQAQDRPDRGYLNVGLTDPLDAPWTLQARQGSVLTEVVPHGAAHRAGLEVGDTVVAVNGQVVQDTRSLQAILRASTRGETLETEVLRGGQRLTLVVETGESRELSTDIVRFSWAEDALIVDLDEFSRTSTVIRELDRRLTEREAHGASRVIVDLRGNGGGDGTLAELLCSRLCRDPYVRFELGWRQSPEARRLVTRPLGPFAPLVWLSKDLRHFFRTPDGELWTYAPEVDEQIADPPFDGELVVLVDEASYSAAAYATHLLQRFGHAEVIGDGPGSGTWFHGQPSWGRLPQSHLQLQVATSTWRSEVGAENTPLVPDRVVPGEDALRVALGRAVQ